MVRLLASFPLIFPLFSLSCRFIFIPIVVLMKGELASRIALATSAFIAVSFANQLLNGDRFSASSIAASYVAARSSLQVSLT